MVKHLLIVVLTDVLSLYLLALRLVDGGQDFRVQRACNGGSSDNFDGILNDAIDDLIAVCCGRSRIGVSGTAAGLLRWLSSLQFSYDLHVVDKRNEIKENSYKKRYIQIVLQALSHLST